MSNTRLGPEGRSIGDPDHDLDYLPRPVDHHIGTIATQTETEPTAEQLFSQRFDWTPSWRAEVTMALDGLEARVTSANHRSYDAVNGQLGKAKGYLSEARYDVNRLDYALDTPHEISTVNSLRILATPATVRVLAKQLLFQKSLETAKWPVQKSDSFDKKLNPLALSLYSMTSEQLTGLWTNARTSAVARERYWRFQLEDAEKMPVVRRLRGDEHHRTMSRR